MKICNSEILDVCIKNKTKQWKQLRKAQKVNP